MNGYKPRKIGKRDTRKLILIICEGKETEINYFKSFKERNSGVNIVPIFGNCTDALNIVRFAKKQMKEYQLDLKKGDLIWCAFDVDDKKEHQIKDAISSANSDNIKIALSNPCIELWFLLHYKKIISSIDRKDVVYELKKFIKHYDKNTQVFDILKDKLDVAMKNAEHLNSLYEKNKTELYSRGSNPSSQVFKLVYDINDTIKKNQK